MTQQEVLIILAMAATFDARLTAGDDTEKLNRSRAWHAALDKDLSFQDGKQFVIDHYADHKSAIMPADINLRWRKVRAHNKPIEQTKQLVRQLEADRSRATGMPESVRVQLDELLKRKS